MSEPKPLTAERLREIRSSLVDHYGIFARQYIEELFAAEAFWREAVKNSVAAFYAGGTTYCAYCRNGISRNFPSSEPLEGHKPDCAWVKARE